MRCRRQGCPRVDYRLGRLDVEVSAGVARLAGAGRVRSIAGGTARLCDVLRRTVVMPVSGCWRPSPPPPPLPHDCSDSTGSPARLRRGLRADLLVVDPDLRPVRVMSAGRWTDGRAT